MADDPAAQLLTALKDLDIWDEDGRDASTKLRVYDRQKLKFVLDLIYYVFLVFRNRKYQFQK